MPHYESLTVSELAKYAAEKPGMLEFLPEQCEWRKLPRQWLIDLLYTYVGDVFEQWVKQRVSARDQAFVDKRALGIAVAPEIAHFFN